jgi:transcriptional regulator with XRE-family HTH domain
MSASIGLVNSNIAVRIFLVNRQIDIKPGKNMTMTKLGFRIRSARKDAQMTQVELAQRVGIAQGTISNLEKGNYSGTASLIDIAMALGVRPEWLATGKGDPKPIVRNVGENTGKEVPTEHLVETIPSLITQLETLRSEIEKTLAMLAGLPSLSTDEEHSYGRNVSPAHDLRKAAERLRNLRPEVTQHANPPSKSRGNKT